MVLNMLHITGLLHFWHLCLCYVRKSRTSPILNNLPRILGLVLLAMSENEIRSQNVDASMATTNHHVQIVYES